MLLIEKILGTSQNINAIGLGNIRAVDFFENESRGGL